MIEMKKKKLSRESNGDKTMKANYRSEMWE